MLIILAQGEGSREYLKVLNSHRSHHFSLLISFHSAEDHGVTSSCGWQVQHLKMHLCWLNKCCGKHHNSMFWAQFPLTLPPPEVKTCYFTQLCRTRRIALANMHWQLSECPEEEKILIYKMTIFVQQWLISVLFNRLMEMTTVCPEYVWSLSLETECGTPKLCHLQGKHDNYNIKAVSNSDLFCIYCAFGITLNRERSVEDVGSIQIYYYFF